MGTIKYFNFFKAVSLITLFSTQIGIVKAEMIWCQNGTDYFKHEVGASVGGRANVRTCAEYGTGVSELDNALQESCLEGHGAKFAYRISKSFIDPQTCTISEAGNAYLAENPTTPTIDDESSWCQTGPQQYNKILRSRCTGDNVTVPPTGIVATLEACAGSSTSVYLNNPSTCNSLFEDTRTAESVWCKDKDVEGRYFMPEGGASSCPDGHDPVLGTQLTALRGCAGTNQTIDLNNAGGSCSSQVAAITGATPPVGSSGVVASTTVIETTPLNEIACNLGVNTLPTARTVASVEFSIPAEGLNINGEILGNAAPTRRSSRRSDDDFDDFGDFDESSGTRDFLQARLLKFCEAQGTSVWSEFTQGIQGSAVDAWDPSWAFFYRRKILGAAGNNESTSSVQPRYLNNLPDDKNLDQNEKHFLKTCLDEKSSVAEKQAFMASLQTALPQNRPLTELKKKLKIQAANGLVEIARHRKNLEKCEALVSLTDHSDYEREYESTGRSAKTIKASFDQQLKCETYGPEAQDFKPCVDFINAYDASMVAKTALQAGQGIHYQSERIEDQNSLSQQGATGGIDHRGALGIQRGEIKDRAGYATQNAALDSAKLATLFGILQSMPNRNKLIDECSQNIASYKPNIISRLRSGHQKVVTAFVKGFGLTVEQIDFSGGDGTLVVGSGQKEDYLPSQQEFLTKKLGGGELCEVTAKNRDAATLIMNDDFRDKAKQILAQTATEAAASFLAAGMLNKQAKQINELLKRIEGYDPSENFVPPSDALLAGPCAFDPSTPGCADGIQPVARNIGFGNNSLSIGGGGFGGNGLALDADTGFDDAATGNTGSSDRSGESGPIGSLLPGNNKSGGFESVAPGAAGVKTSNRAPVGGGAGAGATAVGSTGRGGGGGGAGGSKGGQASGGKSLAYAGSSIGRLSGGRGVGRKPASKDGANPFANMFKKGGPQNDTLNFRNPAGIGSKSGSIFDRISDRYKVVQSKNLLLEYEEKK